MGEKDTHQRNKTESQFILIKPRRGQFQTENFVADWQIWGGVERWENTEDDSFKIIPHALEADVTVGSWIWRPSNFHRAASASRSDMLFESLFSRDFRGSRQLPIFEKPAVAPTGSRSKNDAVCAKPASVGSHWCPGSFHTRNEPRRSAGSQASYARSIERFDMQSLKI